LAQLIDLCLVEMREDVPYFTNAGQNTVWREWPPGEPRWLVKLGPKAKAAKWIDGWPPYYSSWWFFAQSLQAPGIIVVSAGEWTRARLSRLKAMSERSPASLS